MYPFPVSDCTHGELVVGHTLHWDIQHGGPVGFCRPEIGERLECLAFLASTTNSLECLVELRRNVEVLLHV